MDQSTLDFIRSLTYTDTKTLSQKALKASEEVGELAKVVLPFDNAHATLHRFADKQKILEEIADTYLVIQSIAFELGYSYEEFCDMVKFKSQKWAELQSREEKIQGDIPFEIHITVKQDDLDKFRAVCANLGVKPIVLDLQNQKGASVMQDVMTSSVFMGDNPGAYNKMKEISAGMTEAGFTVVREKIETVPWHPAAPSRKHTDPKMPANCYFETHFGIICTDETKKMLVDMAPVWDCHLSQNYFKINSDLTYTIMMTKRVYEGTFEDFKHGVDKIYGQLEMMGFVIDKLIVEFSIYDTKISHDAQWLMNPDCSECSTECPFTV